VAPAGGGAPSRAGPPSGARGGTGQAKQGNHPRTWARRDWQGDQKTPSGGRGGRTVTPARPGDTRRPDRRWGGFRGPRSRDSLRRCTRGVSGDQVNSATVTASGTTKQGIQAGAASQGSGEPPGPSRQGRGCNPLGRPGQQGAAPCATPAANRGAKPSVCPAARTMPSGPRRPGGAGARPGCQRACNRVAGTPCTRQKAQRQQQVENKPIHGRPSSAARGDRPGQGPDQRLSGGRSSSRGGRWGSRERRVRWGGPGGVAAW